MDQVKKCISDRPSSSNSSQSTENGLLNKFGLNFGSKTLVFRVANKEDLLKNKYFCKLCTNAYFNDFDLFQAHMQVHKNEDGKKKCKHCDTSFVSNRALITHCRFAHGDTLGFTCNCGKQFTTRQYLNLHVKSHEIGDRFFCQCGNWYKSDSELAEHKIYCKDIGHTGRYSCDFCIKKFKYPRDKVLHEKSHTGSRTFECQYCHTYFSQLSALTTHERIHRRDQIHKCRYCPAKYTDSSSTRRHEMNAHRTQCQQSAKQQTL